MSDQPNGERQRIKEACLRNWDRIGGGSFVEVYDQRDNFTRVPAGLTAREAARAAMENLGYTPVANEGLALNKVALQPDAPLIPGERYELFMIGGAV